MLFEHLEFPVLSRTLNYSLGKTQASLWELSSIYNIVCMGKSALSYTQFKTEFLEHSLFIGGGLLAIVSSLVEITLKLVCFLMHLNRTRKRQELLEFFGEF